MMLVLRLMCVFISVAVVAPSAESGVLDPELRALLENTSESELASVVAQLRDRVDIASLDISLKSLQASRQQRNQTVITALQEKAAGTQGPLLEYLDSQQKQANVVIYESFWIDNLVTFTAVPSVIKEVAGRDDVAAVFLVPEILFDAPIDESPSVEQISSSEPGLRAINAHKLWRIGITGQGRLVMNIDSGVDGNHPAVASRWRGLLPGVQPGHAWYGPGSFPVETGSTDHGTHVMGTITGRHAGNQDTIGVAPDAHWIAGTSNYPAAFQWAVNPDGNPSTVDDVPDVINCSWFTSSGDQCTAGSTYWSLMDNVEAAGAAVIWSAGNCGPSGSQGSCATGMSPGPYKTITPPKNRVASDVNAFAVGAIDGNSPSYPIAGFSSRGPSACDTTVIKPEVSAPGVSVRSILSNNGYGTKSGTSMAAPHVSGAVALLRQINPNMEVDEVKRALLYSARDLGPPGEDNIYGMGIIDVFAAAERVTPYSVSGIIRDAATLQPVSHALVEVVETDQRRPVNPIGQYEVPALLGSITLRVSAYTYRDTIISLALEPNSPETLHVAIEKLPLALLSGAVTDSLSGQGIVANLAFYAESDTGVGPTYTATSQQSGLFSIGAFVGTYRIVAWPSAPYADSVVIPSFQLAHTGSNLALRLFPVEVLLVDDDGGENWESEYKAMLTRYGKLYRTFDVADSAGALGGVLSSFVQPPVLVWFTGTDSTDALTSGERMTIIGHLQQGGKIILSGRRVVEFSNPGDTLFGAMFGVQYAGTTSGPAFLRGFANDIIGNGVNYLVSAGKNILEVTGLGEGTTTNTLYYTDTVNIAGVRVVGPANNWAAVLFPFGIEELSAVRQDTLMVRSFRYLDGIITSVRQLAGDNVPAVYTLEQNFPNPFNPVTHIRYALPEQSRVTMVIYNVVGQEVAQLVQADQAAGYYEVTWNGLATSGVPVSSGIYFYRLEAKGSTGVFGESRKMIFLK